MHVRIQTWAPYATQIYVNGREWLCRQLPQVGVAFERSDNKILWVSDFEATAALADVSVVTRFDVPMITFFDGCW